MRRALLFALALGLSAPACGARTGLPVPEVDIDGDPDDKKDPGPRPRADKIDLLFMIDNSASMADKQAILAEAVPDLVSRLVNPRCVDESGVASPVAPPSATASCPDGFNREFNAVQDIHIGIISSSLGGHGADLCSPALDGYDPTDDDRGRLIARGPFNNVIPTYQELGFLAWDPAGTKVPPGETSAGELQLGLKDMVNGVGETGCGAEASLEAWYRFLIDPDPYEEILKEDCVLGSGEDDCAVLSGVDAVLLQQRADFLRRDSLVAVIMLTDENDCSIVDGGTGYRVLQVYNEDQSDFHPTPRATSACQIDANDPCCRSCAQPSTPGCVPPGQDPECQKGPYTFNEDPPNLRCFHQKRRYGVDYLHPIERFVRGLTVKTVPDRSGALVQNPLYAPTKGGPGRSPSLVFLAGIIGVPWQDVAVDPGDPDELVYKTAAEMHAEGIWDRVLGDPDNGIAPADPLMIESVVPRTGVNPVTGDALAPPDATSALANPINGHEFIEQEPRDELQYACIFELPTPRDCLNATSHCDCATDDVPPEKPICQDASGAYGTTQLRAKAYPAIRQLAVLKGMGDNAIVSSICARNVTDPTRQDFGYRPALGAILDRLRGGLE
jgi:hypothetical protein